MKRFFNKIIYKYVSLNGLYKPANSDNSIIEIRGLMPKSNRLSKVLSLEEVFLNGSVLGFIPGKCLNTLIGHNKILMPCVPCVVTSITCNGNCKECNACINENADCNTCELARVESLAIGLPKHIKITIKPKTQI